MYKNPIGEMDYCFDKNEVFVFIWKIENFSCLSQKRGENVASPYFHVRTLGRCKFRLLLFPRGLPDEENKVHCEFTRAHSDEGPEVVDFLLNLSAEEMKTSRKTGVFINRCIRGSKLSSGLSIDRQIMYENARHYLPNDTLTFRCEISTKSINPVSFVNCYARTLVRAERHIFSIPLTCNKLLGIAETPGPKQEHTIELPFLCNFNGFGEFEVLLRFNNTLLFEKNADMEVRRVNSGSNPVNLICKISVPDVIGESIVIRQEHKFKKDDTKWIVTYPLTTFKAKLNRPDSIIELRCEFCASDGSTTSFLDRVIYPQINVNNSPDFLPDYESDESKLLRSMFEDKTFCDVTLMAEGKTIPAHKCVLSVRSPVFRAMFESDMKETQTSSVDICDLSAATLNHMLTFVYTNNVDLASIDVSELYAAADKYQILDLRQYCSNFFIETLTVKNVCDVLELADLHQHRDLDRALRNFIYKNAKDVLISSAWKSFMKKHVKLAGEITHQMCIKFAYQM
ncbi:uncharacterized protein [Parasteatoda tepidariorum]|uniref:uncharacterized protein n=1 Tax=Parasteatoda tepidariorum TaxID=114398 RepID=UPI00077FE1FE|nr:uncharacterized protein LOC107445286 [Parasteatoda tepidariorum]